MIESEIFTSFSRYFLRSFGALIIIPINFELNSILKRIILALIFTLFWYQVFGLVKHPQSYYIFELLIGFTIGFSLYLPVLFIIHAVHLIEQARGMNLGSFFDLMQSNNNDYVNFAVKLLIFVLILQAGFFENLIIELGRSFVNIEQSHNQIFLVIKQILDSSLNVLVISFKITIVPVIVFLMLQFCFACISKVYPQISLYSELFVIKLFFTLFLLSHYHEAFTTF